MVRIYTWGAMGKRDMTVAARTPANPRDEREPSPETAASTLRREKETVVLPCLGGFPKCDACVLYGFENRSFYIGRISICTYYITPYTNGGYGRCRSQCIRSRHARKKPWRRVNSVCVCLWKKERERDTEWFELEWYRVPQKATLPVRAPAICVRSFFVYYVSPDTTSTPVNRRRWCYGCFNSNPLPAVVFVKMWD